MSTQANPKYRVEHVATVPQGWKVRTKMSATHMLRIAFPPGARKKGAGKVIEIFHPVNENPCAMRNKTARRNADVPAWDSLSLADQRNLLVRAGQSSKWAGEKLSEIPAAAAGKIKQYLGVAARKTNPGATDAAAVLYETFHGKSPKEILEMQESDAARHTYTALGDLQELVLDAPAGKVKIGFSNADGVKVASAPNGKQLYFLGGNQNLDSQLERFGTDPGKDFVELGAATQLTYRARKSIDNFQVVDYYHDLGEETNEPPYAFYDRLKHRIFLAGGRYRVEAPGIIN